MMIRVATVRGWSLGTHVSRSDSKFSRETHVHRPLHVSYRNRGYLNGVNMPEVYLSVDFR